MPKKKFKTCYVLKISGEATSLLEVSIEEFLMKTAIPLLGSLKNSNEEMQVHVGKVSCTDLEGEPHKCIANIKLFAIDNKDDT